MEDVQGRVGWSCRNLEVSIAEISRCRYARLSRAGFVVDLSFAVELLVSS
jgi:hypothetical protein